jgi:hypothetical protein
VESDLFDNGESSDNRGSMTDKREVIAGRQRSGELRSDNS